MKRPAGVTAVAVIFGLTAIYLCAVGALMLTSQETLPIQLATLLLLGLLRAGAYICLLTGVFAALVSWALWRMNYWARRSAIGAAAVGVIMLVPGVSSPALGWTFAVSGLGMMGRMMILWYLWRGDVAQGFRRTKP
jgi:hypothetical protein